MHGCLVFGCGVRDPCSRIRINWFGLLDVFSQILRSEGPARLQRELSNRDRGYLGRLRRAAGIAVRQDGSDFDSFPQFCIDIACLALENLARTSVLWQK